jgi:UDP-glucose 4-epimerase
VNINEGLQSKPFKVINGGSGIGTSVADIAGELARNWSRGVAVKFSGVVREGDPFSLVADAALARAARFSWHIPVAQGIADYVSWFKESVH